MLIVIVKALTGISVLLEYIIDYPLTPTTVNVQTTPDLMGGNFWNVIKRR